MKSVNTSVYINAVGNHVKVTVHVLPTKKDVRTLKLKPGATAEEAIRALGLFPDAWITVRGDEPIPFDEPLRHGDELRLIAVVSGG